MVSFGVGGWGRGHWPGAGDGAQLNPSTVMVVVVVGETRGALWWAYGGRSGSAKRRSIHEQYQPPTPLDRPRRRRTHDGTCHRCNNKRGLP